MAKDAAAKNAVAEVVVLSTCNRVEFYVAAESPVFPILESFLSQKHSFKPENFATHLYRYVGAEASAHLLRVAAGLDSLVLGEPQILGQVTRALELARLQGTAGPVLTRLFQAAIQAGKRVRTETTIAAKPTSVASVAVRYAADLLSQVDQAHVLVLGAGEMAEQAGEALYKRGVRQFWVVNRTVTHARRLAERWGGYAGTLADLPAALAWADILIAATSAAQPLVTMPLVRRARRQQVGRALAAFDLAVPRNVAPEVGVLPGVSLYNLDALQEYLAQSVAARAEQVPQAEAILAEEAARLEAYLATLNVLPVIKALHQQAEFIRQAELQKTLRRLPDLSPAEQARVEALTVALVNKLLHAPITRLRLEAERGQAEVINQLAQVLYNLPAPGGSSGAAECGISE